MNGGDTAYSNDDSWQARLAADQQRLAEILSTDDREVVDGTLAAADANGDFIVIHGSAARGQGPMGWSSLCRLPKPGRWPPYPPDGPP